MNPHGDRFSQLPSEIIQHIAVAASEVTHEGPPSELAALLQVCRAVHGALCVQHNPGVHAHIFSVKFDSQASIRRFTDTGQPLTALNFAYELRRRWVSLKRIRSFSNSEHLLVCSEEQLLEDLWMLFLMLTESDGHNIVQIHWAGVAKYVRAVLREKLSLPTSPGYVVESTPRTLGLWLMWYFTNIDAVIAESSVEATQTRGMLRSWALASHKYGILCAPYTHWTLPAPNEPDFVDDPLSETSQSLTDLDLHNRAEVVTYMGRHMRLAPPRASLAAIMALMVRIERNGPIPARPAPPIPTPLGQAQPNHPGLTIYPRTRYPNFDGPGSLDFDGRPNRTGSMAYDAEWRRLLQCGSPFAVPKFKIKPLFRPGELAGSWEGRFVFLTFDAFRDMLAGASGAVTSGPIAQLPQVWHIREHHLVSRRRCIPLGRESDVIIGEKLPTGRALDAFIPNAAHFIHHNEPNEFSKQCLEVRVPDSTSPLGYKSYNYITLDDPIDTSPTQIPTDSVSSASHPPINRVDLSPHWDVPQPPTLGEGDDEFDEEILDTVITGEGQSSWGSFKLRGRIRAWDGMIILLKEYNALAGQDHSRWLYTGYMTACGNWVGRWRDTFTPERLNGYEGVFSLTRQF